MIDVTWALLKSIATTKYLKLQCVEEAHRYRLFAADGALVYFHDMDRLATDQTSVSDFDTNFKPGITTATEPRDLDGSIIYRNKAAKSGWTYSVIPIEFKTAKIASTVSMLNDTTNRAGITTKFYDSNNAEITLVGGESTIVKTVVDFEPIYDYEIIGGQVQQNVKPTTDIRVWVIGVPDVSAAYGGSKEMVGGVNLKFIDPIDKVEADGRVSKFMKYDATYHTSKLRFIIRHDAGVQHDLLILLNLFRS